MDLHKQLTLSLIDFSYFFTNLCFVYLFSNLYYFLLLTLGFVCSSFSSFLRCIWGHPFLIQVFTTINFPLIIALAASHKFYYVIFLFVLRYFLTSLLIASLTHWLSGVCCLISTYLWVFQFSFCYWFLVTFSYG